MNSIEEFRDIINRRLRYIWGEIQHEISLFFEKLIYMNIPDEAHPDCISRLSKTREQLLIDFDLSEEKLDDPLSIPQLYKLLYFIKETNFDCFRRGWMTGSDYNHFIHGEHLRDDILPKIKPIVREVQRFKNHKFDELIIKFNSKTNELNFLDYDFEKFRLLQYDAHINIINRVAYDPHTFVLLPLLLRNLFENILHDIFSQALHHQHHDLFYFKRTRRIMNFQHLINLLDLLRSSIFKSVIKQKISDDIIKWLHEIREKGNLSVHEVISNITTVFANEWKNKISLMLEALLISYNKLEGKNLSIPNDEVHRIKKKLGMIKESKGQIVKKKKKTSDDIETDFNLSQNEQLAEKYKKLYNRLTSKNPKHFIIDVKTLVEDIGKIDLGRVLKMEYIIESKERTMLIEYQKWNLSIRTGTPRHLILIKYLNGNSQNYNFELPNQNEDILNEYLKLLKDRCKEQGFNV